jgi:hypothetical protein
MKNDILGKILLHKEVYDNHRLEVPPYRITREELKDVYCDLIPLFTPRSDLEIAVGFHPKPYPAHHYDDIQCIYGVEIEIVTIG